MKRVCLLLLCPALAVAETQLTIYNQNFGVVEEQLALDLKKGEQEVRITDITAHLEPDSVIVRDVKDPGALTVLEQNSARTLSTRASCCARRKGRPSCSKPRCPRPVRRSAPRAKSCAAATCPTPPRSRSTASPTPCARWPTRSRRAAGSPSWKFDGKILFGLPGTPLFDSLGADAFLKPTLLWKLAAAKGGARDVEFSYLTKGMRWEASYNIVAPAKGDDYDIVGWVTLENMSGKDFADAQVKLMAGDVNRAQDDQRGDFGEADGFVMMRAAGGTPAVTERTFDEYRPVEAWCAAPRCETARSGQ